MAFAGVTQFQSASPENVEVGYDVNGDGIGNDRPVLGNPKAPLDTYAFDDSWYYGASQGAPATRAPTPSPTRPRLSAVTATSASSPKSPFNQRDAVRCIRFIAQMKPLDGR